MNDVDSIVLHLQCFIFDMTVFFRVAESGGDWEPLCRFIEVTEEEF